MSENEKPSQQKPDRQGLQAALEALEQEAARRRLARGEPEPVEIITGVPRPEPCPADCTCWRHTPDPAPYDVQAEKRALEKHLEPPNAPPRHKPPPSEPAPPPSREWKYVYVQVRGPPDGDAGVIADAMFTVGDGMVWLEDTKGEPLGRVKLESGDDPASVGRRMLRAKYQIKSSVPGFYDGPINRPTRTFH